jgi:hypothetical protein
MIRPAKDVILKLLNFAKDIRYPAGVKPTPSSTEELLPGFSPFPFGWGLLRSGDEWPDSFPDDPHLVVLHNWGNEEMLKAARRSGGEERAVWWKNRLRPILKERGLNLKRCFFSNALMGLKPGGRSGDMPFDRDYREDCRKFLLFQLEEVNPSSVIHCGDACGKVCAGAYATLSPSPPRRSTIMHPASRPLNWNGLSVQEWIRREAGKIV